MKKGKLMGKIFGLALVFVMIGAMLGGLPFTPSNVAAQADETVYHFDPNNGDTNLGYNGNSPWGVSLDTLPVCNGYHLPASKGYIAYEDEYDAFAAETEYGYGYYINSQWPDKAHWNWDGSYTGDGSGLPPGVEWHAGTGDRNPNPMKVFVYAPWSGKSCIAVIGDSGPAPWTGRQFGVSNKVFDALDLPTSYTRADDTTFSRGNPNPGHAPNSDTNPEDYPVIKCDDNPYWVEFSWADQSLPPGPVAAGQGTTYEETLDIYQYSIGGTIQWTHTYDHSADPVDYATLTIVADDVDGPGAGMDGEQDKVYVNGHYVGLLNDMGFYTNWQYYPGPGNPNFPGAITTTTFTIDPSWLNSMPVKVEVEDAWGAEIETCTLTVVPAVGVNQPPNPPTYLFQYMKDGPEIPPGGTIDSDAVAFVGVVTDPDCGQVKLQIELRRLDEYSGNFIEIPTHESEFVDNDSGVLIHVYGLIVGYYHWQARTMDEHGLVSDWVNFGSFSHREGPADFKIRIHSMPYEQGNDYAGSDALGYEWATLDAADAQINEATGEGTIGLTAAAIGKAIGGGTAWGSAGFTLRDGWKSTLTGEYDVVASFKISGAMSVAKISTVLYGDNEASGSLTASLSVYDKTEGTLVSQRDLIIFEERTEWWEKTPIIGSIGKWLSGKVFATETFDNEELVIKGPLELKKNHEYEWTFGMRMEGEAAAVLADAAWVQGLIDGVLMEIRLECDGDPERWFPTIDLPFEHVTADENLTLTFHCPVAVMVIDPEGKRIGVDFESMQEVNEIPGAWYSSLGTHPQFVTIPAPLVGNYTILVLGTDADLYGFTLVNSRTHKGTEEEAIGFIAIDLPISVDEVHQYIVDWDALSLGEDGVTVSVDSDGDGEFEHIITSDGELTHDEFILQTETTVVFEPDVLNLNSRGKYVTAYIELPTGYNISQIDIFSVRLNDTVPALGKPTEIGDYDSDGVPDLMVKFDRAAVQDALTLSGALELTITGEVAGIGFEGGDTIKRVITPTPPGHTEWTQVTTPTTQGFVLAPDSVIVDYAVDNDGDVAYAIVYSYDTSQFHLLKSTDGAATWEDTMDALEEEADGDISWLVAVATDAEDAEFVAVALEMTDLSVHVFVSDDGGATFEDVGEVEDGGVYFPDGYHVSDLEVSPERNDKREIAIGGYDNNDKAALFRCTVTGDGAGAWVDATGYDGWDNMDAPMDDIDSDVITDIIFSTSWGTDKTILVTTVDVYGTWDEDVENGAVYLQCGSWGTSAGWNEMSTLGIEAVPIMEDVDIPLWLADLDARTIAGITVPSDYNSKNTNTRVLWVWVNYYDGDTGDPMCTIMRVDDDSACPLIAGEFAQVDEGEVWLTNISYKGTIDEGEAIAGVLGTGTYDPVHGSPDDLITECCEGVQVYRHDGIRDMDICCERWHDACKPPTGSFAMAVSYVGEDKAYAVSLWGFFLPYDEDAWSVTFDDGDTWNQLSLIDTHIDYLSDVAVSPDCNKTMLVSVNEESGCGCDSVWLHAEHLPEAEEYDGKWLRTWCGQLEGLDNDGYEHGILRLPPNETTGDTVYLADLGSNNVYQLYREIYDVDCWCSIASTELDYIVDLVAQDANTVLALDYYGDVAMFDDDEWQEAVDSEVDNGYTIAVWGGHVLVGGQNGDVSYSNDGGETFALLEEFPTIDGYVSVAFDTYFDTNNVIYAALANAGDDNGIYRWVIGESEEWEDLGAEDYAYTGLVLNAPSGGKPETSPDTGGVLYASYVSGDTTGVARCLTPAEDVCCSGTDWDYLTRGLTSELFKMMPQALKICGGLTTDTGSRLFAIDSSDYYDMESGMTGTVWSFED